MSRLKKNTRFKPNETFVIPGELSCVNNVVLKFIQKTAGQKKSTETNDKNQSKYDRLLMESK